MTCTSHTPEQARMVTLLDGREVCSCSQDWMRECECRWLLERQDLRQRREYLAKVSREARARIEATLTVLWDRRMGRVA